MKIKPFKAIKEDIEEPAIELYGNRRIIITDCKCVLDYCDDYIILDLGEKNLKITGSDLIADSFNFGQTDIKGNLEKIEFI